MQEYCDTATAHFFERVKLLCQPLPVSAETYRGMYITLLVNQFQHSNN